MQKFTQFANQSRFKKYAFNAPALYNPKQKRKETPPSPSKRRQKSSKKNGNTLQQNSLLEASRKTGSIRSSVERMRSGKLDRTEIVNRQMTKSALKRQRRLNTEKKDMSYQHRINGLKKHVNQLNMTCNRVVKGEETERKDESRYTFQQRKKFIMGQISFTEIDEERVISQKKYLKKFQYLAKSMPKMMEVDLPTPRDIEEGIISALRTIDRIYISIRSMEDAGYVHRNNKFLVDYCRGGRVWLRRVFLLETTAKREAFTMAVKYSVVKTSEEAKQRFADFIARSQGEDMSLVVREIEGLHEHLQHSLTQKKIAKLMNITDEIDNWGKRQAITCKPKLRYSQASEAQLRLTEDLQSLQAQFGPMREISKISRRRYEQLNRTYDRLQSYI